MELTFLQFISPFAIFLIAFLFSTGLPKIYYLALPTMALCLHLYYTQWAPLQIALMIIWGFHLLATWRMAGFSKESIYKRKLLVGILIAISAILSALLLWWWNAEWKDWKGLIAIFLLCVWIIYYTVVRTIAYFVIAPLFCRQQTTITAILQDYKKVIKGYSRSKMWHSYIRFKDDPTEYEVGFFQFGKYRNKISIPFSYEKCECPFGFTYIRKVRQLSQSEGKPSQWDIAPTTQIQRKINKVITIGFIIIAVLIVIVLIVLAVNYLRFGRL